MPTRSMIESSESSDVFEAPSGVMRPSVVRGRHRRRLAASAAILLVVAAGCGGGDDKSHNAADVTFAQGMIPHHEQAIVMSDLALQQAESPQVKDLATRIKAAQGPEITQMQGWLKDWKEPVEADGGDHGEHGGMEGGGGMLSDADMQQLEVATGPQFDRLFLEGMIRHHEGAVTMAEKELADGKFPDAKKLAESIITSQQAEIAEMKALQAGS